MPCIRLSPLVSINLACASGLVAKKLAGEEWVFLNLENGVYYGLNETGSLIWDELKNQKAPEKILDKLEAAFPIERPRLKKDLWNFLKELRKEGVIRYDAALEKA